MKEPAKEEKDKDEASSHWTCLEFRFNSCKRRLKCFFVIRRERNRGRKREREREKYRRGLALYIHNCMLLSSLLPQSERCLWFLSLLSLINVLFACPSCFCSLSQSLFLSVCHSQILNFFEFQQISHFILLLLFLRSVCVCGGGLSMGIMGLFLWEFIFNLKFCVF